MQCPRCQHQNPPRAKFCEECATPLARTCANVYRSVHGLDTPASEIGPSHRVAVRRSYRSHRLSDGTVVRPADRIGVLHLNNTAVAVLHAGRLSPIAVGLEFRRQIVASLEALAVQAGPGGQLATLKESGGSAGLPP